MSAYTPSNTADACPPVNSGWAAIASPLPPTPNAALCTCMTNSLTCGVAAGVTTDAYGDIFNYICSANSAVCAGIVHNATTGTFGAYSVCNSAQQLGFVMNQYYFAQPSAARASACNFNGHATSRAAATAAGTCAALISQAGGNGNGTVATPTGNSSSGSQATHSAGTSSKAAAHGLSIPSMDTGMLQLGIYVCAAALTGVGMVLL